LPAGIVLLAAHACLTEIAQLWIPARSPDVWDALANIAGLSAACLLGCLPAVVRKPAIAV
jgi:VanZ family protein